MAVGGVSSSLEQLKLLGVGRYSETQFDTYHDTLGTIMNTIQGQQ